MAKYYYNGVLLPGIPADVLETFPHCWMDDNAIRFVCSAHPWYFQNNKMNMSESAENRRYTLNSAGDGWELSDTFTDTGGYSINTLIWSSHDIPLGSLTSANIYFEGSDPVPEEPEKPEYAERYSILGSILVGTARQIMRLTDSTTKVKPEEFEAKLEGINIQLQELTVTATEEVQTITPPSGVYGFSKVIVEAVEDSGTGGGGTGPGGGGEGEEPEESYTSAANMTFGYEYVEEEAPTGMSYYYKADGTYYTDAPDLPADATYAMLISTNSGVALYAAPSPMTVNSWYAGVRDETGDTTKVMKYYTLNDAKTGWEYVRTDYSGSVSNARWANHTITNYSDGSVYMAAGTSKQKMEVTTVAKPLERNETYTIDGESLNSLVGLAQTITGSNTDMTPTDAIEALEEYAEKLATGEI